MRTNAVLVVCAALVFLGCGTTPLDFGQAGNGGAGGVAAGTGVAGDDGVAGTGVAGDDMSVPTAGITAIDPYPWPSGDAGTVSVDGNTCVDHTLRGQVGVYEVGVGVVAAEMGASLASFSGVVTELGSEALPADVDFVLFNSSGDDADWIRIKAGDGKEWVVAKRDLALGFAVAVGTIVDVEYSHDFGGWTPERASLTLRVGGQLAFYFGRDARPNEMPVPEELTVNLSNELCRTHEECGDYAQYDMSITFDGQSAIIGTDESVAIGDYYVWHGGTQGQLSSNSNCSDWYVADTTVAVAHDTPIYTVPLSTCGSTSFTTLPGVHIEIDDSVCSYTLAQAMAGITFKYKVVIDDDVSGVTPSMQDQGNCQAPHASGLYLGERVAGDGESYCLCDTGLCAPSAIPAATLKAGEYEGTFAWDGHNWSGPSDTNNPEGALFPAGTYSFSVHSTGIIPSGSFETRASLTFTLK